MTKLDLSLRDYMKDRLAGHLICYEHEKQN